MPVYVASVRPDLLDAVDATDLLHADDAVAGMVIVPTDPMLSLAMSESALTRAASLSDPSIITLEGSIDSLPDVASALPTQMQATLREPNVRWLLVAIAIGVAYLMFRKRR